jgi:hypothetical protein
VEESAGASGVPSVLLMKEDARMSMLAGGAGA